MACCENEEQTASTFGQMFGKCQALLNYFLEGDIFNFSNFAITDKDDDSNQNVIVTILFVVHIAFVFCFLAHHCTPRGGSQTR